MTIKTLLYLALEKQASDLHIASNTLARIRVDGELIALNESILSADETKKMLGDLLNEQQQKQFSQQGELDFSYTLDNSARLRVNLYQDRHGLAAAFRFIPEKSPDFLSIHAPAILSDLCQRKDGLILITGASGSGKSTTLTAMVHYLNENTHRHIISIEDPIEFLHESKNCLINQREVGQHTQGFQQALRSALREDPDVILIGELRDLETIRLALSAAETGHLVFATLHTVSAAKAIHRIMDVFPAEEKAVIRSLLADSLSAVIAQTLFKKTGGGRIAAHEVMICTPAIRNLIREDKVTQIYSTIQTGSAIGMVTLEQSIEKLIKNSLINPVNQ